MRNKQSLSAAIVLVFVLLPLGRPLPDIIKIGSHLHLVMWLTL